MVNIELNTIYNDNDAKLIAAALKIDGYLENGHYGERDAANGALEAYFVTTLRNTPKEGLGARLEELKGSFGTLNAFKRAVDRVKAFRGKNPAWRTFSAS